MNVQSQAGRDAVSIQAKSIRVSQGITVQEARDIALDVFRSNFYHLSGQAKELAVRRGEDLTERLLREMSSRYPEGLDAVADPDMQYALFTAQRDYARHGDSGLADALVDLLVERSRVGNRSLKQIVLTESIQVVSRLTGEQIAALSVIFGLRYTTHGRMNSIEALRGWMELVLPFAKDIPKTAAPYQHLEYAGCGSIGPGTARIEGIVKSKYPAIVSKGFASDQAREALGVGTEADAFLIPCLHDPDLLQVDALSEDDLRTRASASGLPEVAIDALIRLQRQHAMQPSEVKVFLRGVHQEINDLIEDWDAAPIGRVTLTSVGIAIGHANTRRLQRSIPGLEVWIT